MLDPDEHKENTLKLAALEKAAIEAAVNVTNNSSSRLESIQNLLELSFPYQLDQLQQAEKDFDEQLRKDGYYSANKLLNDAMPAYRDLLGLILKDFIILEDWLLLTLDYNVSGTDGPLRGAQDELLDDIQKLCTQLETDMNAELDYHKSRKDTLGGCGYSATKVETETMKLTSTSDAVPPARAFSEVIAGDGPAQVMIQTILTPTAAAVKAASTGAEKEEKNGNNNQEEDEEEQLIKNIISVEKERKYAKGSVTPLTWYDGQKAHLTTDVAMYLRMLTSLTRYMTYYKATMQRAIRIQRVHGTPERKIIVLLFCLKGTMSCLCGRG